MNKKAISPVVASALLLVVAVVAVVGFQTWFGNYSSGIFTKTELQSNSDNAIQIEKIIGNTVYLKNSKNTTISLSKLKVGSIDCNVNQNLSYGVTGIDISSCLAQITSKSQNIVAYTNKAVVSKDVYISDWDSTTPYLSLSSNWTTIPYNTSVNLSWSGNNLNTCTASGAWSGSKSTSNSEVISNLITNSTFTLDCTSSSVNVSKSVDVVVTDLPIITFSAENSSIPFNSSTNLVWSVANADTCTASGNWSGSKTTSGTYNTSNLDVSGNHSYTLTCNGFGGQSASTIIVTVDNYYIPVNISFNTNNYNLSYDLITNYGWDGVSPIYIKIVVDSGVKVGSRVTCHPVYNNYWANSGCLGLSNQFGAWSYGWGDNQATFLANRYEVPALDLCVINNASNIILENNGRIIGHAGVGANTYNWWGPGGNPGGAAVRTCGNLKITKVGELWGGGGGGGAGYYSGGGCSGSTGAGSPANYRAGCEGACIWPNFGNETHGGTGNTCGTGSAGGKGGDIGQWGANGNGGLGGPPGASIIGYEYVTWLNSTSGDIKGPTYTYTQATTDGRVDFFP